MKMKSKVKKLGNSFAIKLPTKALKEYGFYPSSEVNIQAGDGCLIIQLRGKSLERYLDDTFSDTPEAKELYIAAREKFCSTITRNTDNTLEEVELIFNELKNDK